MPKKDSVIKAFENTFLGFEDFTFGTAPGIRHVFECGTGRNSVFGIPFCRIIDVMAFKTNPAGHFYNL